MWRMVWIVLVAWVVVLAGNKKGAFSPSQGEPLPTTELLSEHLIDLDQDGHLEKVTRSKTEEGILIEIYQLIEKQEGIIQERVGSHKFPAGNEGFILFRTSITHIAFEDLDKNGQLEIIVSFFDKTTKKSSFCTLAWNKTSKKLDKVQREEWF